MYNYTAGEKKQKNDTAAQKRTITVILRTNGRFQEDAKLVHLDNLAAECQTQFGSNLNQRTKGFYFIDYWLYEMFRNI